MHKERKETILNDKYFWKTAEKIRYHQMEMIFHKVELQGNKVKLQDKFGLSDEKLEKLLHEIWTTRPIYAIEEYLEEDDE